jgi:hypothetical protein
MMVMVMLMEVMVMSMVMVMLMEVMVMKNVKKRYIER